MSKTYRVSHIPKPVEITLSAKEASALAIQCICEVSNWKPDWYLTHDSGTTHVAENVQAYTTHSFSYEEKIRQATTEDLLTFKLVEKLKKL
jgi:hypothetical protein